MPGVSRETSENGDRQAIDRKRICRFTGFMDR